MPDQDDTFIKLRRPPVEQMWKIYLEWSKNFLTSGDVMLYLYKRDLASEEFCKSYGWTTESLAEEVRKSKL